MSAEEALTRGANDTSTKWARIEENATSARRLSTPDAWAL